MVERFHEPDRAVAYLCAALRPMMDGQTAEVTWYPTGHLRPRRVSVEANHVGYELERFSARFAEATAIYDLECDGFAVAGLQCRCPKHVQAVCPCNCQHKSERPVISVILYDTTQPTDDTRAKALNLIRNEIDVDRHSGKDERVKRFRRLAHRHL